mmetsp:Transcript_9702/g.29504  ORF Transcript_9702/g.29504 Transcript_9702/m.29504 type:complete len:379 (+) Transcript_9702:124-1260(+)
MESLKYKRGHLEVLDQLLLPTKTRYIAVENAQDAYRVIKEMNVRGAPLIAIVAALGLAVEAHHELKEGDALKSAADAVKFLIGKMEYLKTSRPTAVNLSNAVDALSKSVRTAGEQREATVESVVQTFLTEAEAMPEEDRRVNRLIGKHGAEAILKRARDKQKVNILHICNTGSLATAGYGTALGIVRALHEMGRLERMYIMETRPYLQGARLTAYEAVADEIPGTLIPDSAVASLMAVKGIDACVAGADRIARNGDTANKIGTLQMAIVAAHYQVPVFVAAPVTTLDLSMQSGSELPIEERSARELTCIKKMPYLPDDIPEWLPIAPEQVDTWNPAFDVTRAKLITGISTEVGLASPTTSSGEYDLAAFVEEATRNTE